MSFTTGSLFRHESVQVASVHEELGDWKAVRSAVVSANLLQARTVKSLTGICREIITRLRTLSQTELTFLVRSTSRDQAYLLWLAICRRYRFIGEFVQEVLCERFRTLRQDLNYEDFDAFFNARADWHLELEQIRPSTRKKLRQVLFRMLREVDLLSQDNEIQAALLGPSFLELLSANRPEDVLYFPILEPQLQRMR